jgi:hypothetical protein
VRNLSVAILSGVAGAMVAGFAGAVYIVSNNPDLEVWHTATLDEEFSTQRSDEIPDFEAYRRLEEELFAQLERNWIPRCTGAPPPERRSVLPDTAPGAPRIRDLASPTGIEASS